MKNLITFSILLVASTSCSLFTIGSSINSIYLNIQYYTQANEKMLLDSTSGYNYDDIKMYYVNTDQEYVTHFSSRASKPYYKQLKENGTLYIQPVFGDIDGTYTLGGKSTTYIDFGNGDIDTLQILGIDTHDKKEIVDVWYNGEEIDLQVNQTFKIIK